MLESGRSTDHNKGLKHYAADVLGRVFLFASGISLVLMTTALLVRSASRLRTKLPPVLQHYHHISCANRHSAAPTGGGFDNNTDDNASYAAAPVNAHEEERVEGCPTYVTDFLAPLFTT